MVGCAWVCCVVDVLIVEVLEIEARVLSIQSHVVAGYVGNRSAVFPLQLLGIETDAINTCQFSNHTGYPSWEGERLTGEQLSRLMEGMERNGLAGHTHILTGYAGRADLLHALERVVQTTTRHRPDAVYLCDPVMGDNGKLYVAEEVVGIYADVLVPLAHIVTPNHFEAELLAGMKITNETEAVEAMEKLHSKGVRAVVITSTDLYGVPGELALLASHKLAHADGGPARRFRIRMPALEGYFTGTGDLFAALLLAWHIRHPDDFVLACEKAVCGTHAVLRETIQYYARRAAAAAAGGSSTAVAPEKAGTYPELKIIPSKGLIEHPPLLFRAEDIK